MAFTPPLHELERRVARDPASVSFALLAEEYRRLGRIDDAIRTARAGLQVHPEYVSGRVTLGRALLEQGNVAAARRELEAVLVLAPENLAAIRALADLHDSDPAPVPRPDPPGTPALPVWQERQTPTGPFSWEAPDAPRAMPPERHPFFAPRTAEDLPQGAPPITVASTGGTSWWGLAKPAPVEAVPDWRLPPDPSPEPPAVTAFDGLAVAGEDAVEDAVLVPMAEAAPQAVPGDNVAEAASGGPLVVFETAVAHDAPLQMWEVPTLESRPVASPEPELQADRQPDPDLVGAWTDEPPAEAPVADGDRDALARLEAWLGVVQADRDLRRSMRW